MPPFLIYESKIHSHSNGDGAFRYEMTFISIMRDPLAFVVHNTIVYLNNQPEESRDQQTYQRSYNK